MKKMETADVEISKIEKTTIILRTFKGRLELKEFQHINLKVGDSITIQRSYENVKAKIIAKKCQFGDVSMSTANFIDLFEKYNEQQKMLL